MPRILNVLIVSVVFVSLVPADTLEPLTTSPVTALFSTGRKATAYVDHRTTDEKLWLRFGNAQVQIVRQLDWDDVTLHSSDGAVLTQAEIFELAALAKQARGDGDAESPSPQPAIRDDAPPALIDRRIAKASPRPAMIRFDAELANWDADIETDGLVIRVESLDAYGRPVAVRGQVNAQLWVIKQVDQDAQPRSRGRGIQRIAQSSTAISTDLETGADNLVRLPFDGIHPEIDWDLSSFGIVHVELVAPGQGVFHHTLDGVRIRPFTPVRDVWHLHGRSAFFPVEPVTRQ